MKRAYQPAAQSKTASQKSTPSKKGLVGKTSNGGIPKAPATKALTFKSPKLKGKDTGKIIEGRLKKQSPWFQSISDPLHGADCKIPDETGVETGTLQIVQRAIVTSPASGVCGAKILTPYVNNSNVVAGTGVNFQIVGSTATATTISWGDGTTAGVGRGFQWNGSEEIQEITNAHRIVSCGMYVQPEPSLSENKGEITLFANPFVREDSPLYNDYMNSYKSVVVPLNSNKASCVLWYPVAREDWSFKSFIRTNGNVLTDDDISESCEPFWGLGFVTDGLAEGVVLRFTMVTNLEFIPKYNTLNVLGATPSPQDVTETDLVQNWVQDMPIARPVSQAVAASSPSTVTPSHEDDETGFGMFFNVVKEILPIAMSFL